MCIIAFISLLIIRPSVIAKDIAFKDVTKQEWYYEDLQRLIQYSIINGFPDGTFRGNQPLNLDEFIKTVAVIHDCFIDSNSDYWAQGYIQKAFELEWLNHTYPTSMNQTVYNRPVSRYEIVEIISRTIHDEELSPNYDTYSLYIQDFNEIPEQYKPYVLKAYANGYMLGYPDGTFQGNQTLTRAEGTALLLRLLKPTERVIPMKPSIKVLQKELFKNTRDTQFISHDVVKYKDNQLYYQDETDTWISIKDTNIYPCFQAASEELLTTYLEYAKSHHLKDQIFAGYGYGTYSIGLLSTDDYCPFIVRLTDHSSDISLTVNTLYENNDEFLSENYTALLKQFTDTFFDQDSEKIMELILKEYNKQEKEMGYENTVYWDKYQFKIVKNDFGMDMLIDMDY